MTHKDIYTKFMIEYDKANVTSSYPSLTEYEVATVLDKAYNALIALKVTGNNYRRAPFEADTKAISDIAPLVTSEVLYLNEIVSSLPADNVRSVDLPDNFLYYVQSNLLLRMTDKKSVDLEHGNTFNDRNVPVQLVDHATASKFFASAYNIPWIKNPVCYIEGDKAYVVYDPVYTSEIKGLVRADKKLQREFKLMYIKHPNTFVKDLDAIQKMLDVEANSANRGYDVHFFDIQGTGGIIPADVEQMYQFECNATVAEELVSLAISFALENIESPRLNTKLNMRGLEA